MAALNFYCLYSHQCGVQSRGRPASVAAGCIMSRGTVDTLYSGQWSPGPGQCHGNVRQCYNTAGVDNVVDIIFYCFTDSFYAETCRKLKAVDIACFIESVLMIYIHKPRP